MVLLLTLFLASYTASSGVDTADHNIAGGYLIVLWEYEWSERQSPWRSLDKRMSVRLGPPMVFLMITDCTQTNQMT